MVINPTTTLADFVANTRYDDLPEQVISEAKRVLLDSLGVSLASQFTERGKIAIAFARQMGGPPEASIIVTGDKVSCSNAAFANGEMMNDLDYDALMRVKDRTPHITPFVMPAPLAVAEHQGASGKELLLAIVLAHEIGARVVSSVRAIRSWQGEEQEGPLAYGYSSATFGGAIGVCKILAS